MKSYYISPTAESVELKFGSVIMTSTTGAGLGDLDFGLVLGRTAYTTTRTNHSFDEVIRELAHLEKCKCFLTLETSGCTVKLKVTDILASLLHALDNCVSNAAACSEALTPD